MTITETTHLDRWADDGGPAERETEGQRLRADLVAYRAYLAGPCNRNVGNAPRCPRGPYSGHRHWNAWYTRNRSTVVTLNSILDGTFDREVWMSFARTLDPSEL